MDIEINVLMLIILKSTQNFFKKNFNKIKFMQVFEEVY